MATAIHEIFRPRCEHALVDHAEGLGVSLKIPRKTAALIVALLVADIISK